MTVHVDPAEYRRLLGYPKNAEMSERAGELAAWARDWYDRHGHPWVHERHVAIAELRDFTSAQLQSTLDRAGSHAAVVVAASAGPELEAETRQLWQSDKPDEYFFLEIFGSAVVEHLIAATGARLCAWAAGRALAALPHFSPGYGDWTVAEQPGLLALLGPTLPGQLEALDSGALRPKKSQLAVFGLTVHTDRVRPLTGLVPCENCAFAPCHFRRAPYRDAPPYSTNLKALKRWATERLSLESRTGGAVDARFRYDGTTCTNMGRALAFEYRVRLGPRDQGYPICEQSCRPLSGDTGYTCMCRYIQDPAGLMLAIETEKPLHQQPLETVLSWQRPNSPAGCYCDRESRDHKWGLVLETIHYALARRI